MMLYLIGLGLNDENDIPPKAIDAIKKCEAVYLELFTNQWSGDIKKLEALTKKKIVVLGREKVESNFLIEEAKSKHVALLVPGDPLTATTHFSLFVDAKNENIDVEVIHASSIYTAVAETGLQLYKFGRTTTLPKPQKNFDPKSPIEIIRDNRNSSFHSLILLDIGMTAKEGLKILKDNGLDNELFVVCCNLGSRSKMIRYGTITSLMRHSIDKSPAVIILPGNLNFKEQEALDLWK